MWPDEFLLDTPNVNWIDYRGPDYTLEYENVSFEGRMTTVFASYSLPRDYATGKIPAIVLVHGSVGKSFPSWAAQWASYGYAAIAVDLTGSNVAHGRPWASEDWSAGESMDARETWYYHAPSAVINAISFLEARPEVDASKIGLLGVSWGGWVTSIVAGVDRRISYSISVYGTGFIWENSVWSPIKSPSIRELFDPANHLPGTSLPMLWISGLDDFAYANNARRKTYRLNTGPNTLSIRRSYDHDYGSAWGTPEIRRYADSFAKDGPALLRFVEIDWTDSILKGRYEGGERAERAAIISTDAAEPWTDFAQTSWEANEARIDLQSKTISADIPPNARVFYLHVFDENSSQTSSDHVDLTIDAGRTDLLDLDLVSKDAIFEIRSTHETDRIETQYLLAIRSLNESIEMAAEIKNEDELVIDLRQRRIVGGFDIVSEMCAQGLTVWISEDGELWSQVWKANPKGPRVSVKLENRFSARYLKIETQETDSFLLRSLKIYGEIE